MKKLNSICTFIIVQVFTCVSISAFAHKSCFHAISTQTRDTIIAVPLGGNTWRTGTDTAGGNISNDGIVNWNSNKAEFVTYIRFAKKGKFKLWLTLNKNYGKSRIAVSALKKTRYLLAENNSQKDYYAGEWTVNDTGYIAFKIKGRSKKGDKYPDISNLKLSGTAVDGKTAFVKNNDGDFFYWGKRGPSVHLSYVMPDNKNAEWFYNEVTVQKGNDVVGSYFMADGFAEGYFGMQVNSPTERHILFSVWSPFKTDNPGQIPEDQKIIMLKKGAAVHTGEFGNEGSGGQSYLLYDWKAGNTYKFLMRAKPDGNNHTVYTAYFFAPEIGKWQLIASFSRPQTNTWLKHLHSFLENFDPEQGTITRKVFFNNEWIADENGKWTELNQAKFTIDNTGAVGYRMDYAGGVLKDAFYLENCGFFNDYTIRNKIFERSFSRKTPDVDLDKMP